MKERDEARAALERAAANPASMAPPAAVPSASTAQPMDEDASGVDVGISETVKVCKLLVWRKMLAKYGIPAVIHTTWVLWWYRCTNYQF